MVDLLAEMDVANEAADVTAMGTPGSPAESLTLAELMGVLRDVPGVGNGKLKAIEAAVSEFLGKPREEKPRETLAPGQKTLLIDDADPDPIADATRLGALAAAREESVAKNPHPRGSMLWHAWDNGWQREYCKPQPAIESAEGD